MKNFFQRLSIKRKLLLGFGIVAVALSILGIQRIFVLNSFQQVKNRLVKNLNSKEALLQSRLLIRQDMENAGQLVLIDGPNELENLIEQHDDIKDRLQQQMRAVEAYCNTSEDNRYVAEKRRILQTLLDSRETYQNILLPAFNNVIELKTEILENPGSASVSNSSQIPGVDEDFGQMNRQTGNANQEQLNKNKLQSQTRYIVSTGDKIDQNLNDAIAENKNIERSLKDESENLVQRAKIQTALIIAAGILLAVLIAILLANVISQPISRLKSLIVKLGKGELPKEVNVEAKDEVGQMGDALDDLVDGLRKTSEFAQEIGKGDFSTEYKPLSQNDVLGNSLLEMRQSLKLAQEEEEKRKLEDQRRTWATEGISKFNEILRQHNEDMEQLSNEVLINLVKYVKANQGGLFVYNDSDKDDVFLELKSAYAFDRKKFLEKKIKPSEGLVGMCFVEKYTYNLTDVPEEYMEIESGLGDANPTNIIIVPMIVEDQPLGVLELASFTPFKDYEVRFIERVANNAASSISTLKINARTSELLKQSQRQAEEMQEQEEEMRQNIEEMQATQEQALRREERLKEQVQELESEEKELQKEQEQKNLEIQQLKQENQERLADIAEKEKLSRNILESSLDAVIIINEEGVMEFFNEAAEQLFGYNQNEVLGQNISMLMPRRHSKHHDQSIQNYLKSGNKKIIGIGREIPILRKDGTEATAHLSVIENKAGDERKFTGFLRDMTESKKLEEKRNTLLRDLINKEIQAEDRITTLENKIHDAGLEVPFFTQTQETLLKFEQLKVGIKMLDDEHEKWINLANKFYSSLINKEKEKTVMDNFKEYLEFTHFHFDNEEFYLKKFEYENEQEHSDYHHAYLKKLDQLRENLAPENFETAYSLLMYMRNWMKDHILNEDMKLVDVFKANNL